MAGRRATADKTARRGRIQRAIHGLLNLRPTTRVPTVIRLSIILLSPHTGRRFICGLLMVVVTGPDLAADGFPRHRAASAGRTNRRLADPRLPDGPLISAFPRLSLIHISEPTRQAEISY